VSATSKLIQPTICENQIIQLNFHFCAVNESSLKGFPSAHNLSTLETFDYKENEEENIRSACGEMRREIYGTQENLRVWKLG
jgi:hypothetical protein